MSSLLASSQRHMKNINHRLLLLDQPSLVWNIDPTQNLHNNTFGVFLPGSKCHWKPGPSNSKSNIETSLESSYHLSQLLPARWGTSLKSDAIAVLVSGLVSIAFFCLPKKALMCHKLKAMQKVSAKENSWFRNCAKKFENVSNVCFRHKEYFLRLLQTSAAVLTMWVMLLAFRASSSPATSKKGVNETHHVP